MATDSSISSSSSTDTYVVPPLPCLPSTSVSGRRGSRSRGKGKSPVSGRGKGKGPASSSGRGRGGARGKRKQPGAFHLTEDEIGRLQRLREARKQNAKDMIKNLKDDEKDAILEAAVEAYPSMILNLMNKQKDGAPEPPSPDDNDCPNWCICGHCREMPTDASSVCCGMRPHLCHILMPEMTLTITDESALTMQRMYRNDMFARQDPSEEDYAKAMRHAAYRQYILFIHGRLGQGVRKPVPSCVTWFIRDKYPDPHNHYVDYEPSW